MNKTKIGINGYGVIGKRIADAVLLQDNMELVGVTALLESLRVLRRVRNCKLPWSTNTLI